MTNVKFHGAPDHIGVDIVERTPKTPRFTALPQQEANCFAEGGQSIYISSEGQSAALLYIDLKAFPSIP